MKTTSSLPFLLIWVASSFAQETSAPDSPAVTAPVASSVSFLIPADGDVNYATELKVIARVEGNEATDLLPVLDGFSGGPSLLLEKNILTLYLTGLAEGAHEIRMLYLDSGKVVSTPKVHFFVRTPEPKRDTVVKKIPFVQSGKVTARAERRDRAAASRIVKQSELLGIEIITLPETDTTWPYDSAAYIIGKGETPFSKNLNAGAEVTYNAKLGHWKGSLKGLVSSDENRFRQTANSASGSLAYGPWAAIRGGDFYPAYNPLILTGIRLRGAEADASLITGDSLTHWATIKAATGETRREVPAYVVQSEATGGGYRLDYVPGSYPQTLTAVRVGAGGGETFDLGVTLMKSSQKRGDSLFEDLNAYLYGPRPVENLVSGLDARLGLWQSRIQLYAQGAVSFYTRDRSLGAFSIDTAPGAFDPAQYQQYVVINPTTSGWQYLLTDSVQKKPDSKGFANASSTWQTGVSASIPFSKFVWETDASYSHTGTEYHSEGNPGLDGNPADGWDVAQRLGLMQNRLTLGAGASNYIQNLIDYKQVARSYRGDIRVSPGAYSPILWLNGSVTSQSPRGHAPYQYTQDYDEVNMGGTHKQVAGPGTLNLSTQYGFSYSKLNIEATDTSQPAPYYPASKTHTVSSSAQYKFRGTDLQPKVSHAYGDNGVQKPTNNGTLGVQDAFFSRRLTADFNLLLGQYPKTRTRNDLSFGQNAALALRIGAKQTLRGYEKWSKYGDRILIISGANYEMFF